MDRGFAKGWVGESHGKRAPRDAHWVGETREGSRLFRGLTIGNRFGAICDGFPAISSSMKRLLFLLLALWVDVLMAADRVALVIGNGRYAEPLQKLEACARDAATMATTFRKLGIRIHGGAPQLDLDADQMDSVLNEFVRSLTKDSEAFIYYSGHGAQIGGSNFLLPVNFKAKFESQARRQAVSLDAVLEMLDRTDSSLRVVILDSCRDPGEFLPGEPALKGPGRPKGLGEQKVSTHETLVCFATKHGTAALADDNSSYYTRVLAEEIVKPGKMEDVMKSVARRVFAETDSKQLPFTYGSLLHDHSFVPGTAGATTSSGSATATTGGGANSSNANTDLQMAMLKKMEEMAGKFEELTRQQKSQSAPPSQTPPPVATNQSFPPGPPPPQTTVPPGFSEFIAGVARHQASNDAAEWASDFAPMVDYCYKSKGLAARSFVQNDRYKLLQRYPARNYSNFEVDTLEVISQAEVRCAFKFNYAYAGQKRASGRSRMSLTVKNVNGRWQITRMDESVVRN